MSEGFPHLEGRGVAPEDSLECNICWYVYDPAEGDEVWQIPPGTPFQQLPAEWRCPVCDAPPEKFLPV